MSNKKFEIITTMPIVAKYLNELKPDNLNFKNLRKNLGDCNYESINCKDAIGTVLIELFFYCGNALKKSKVSLSIIDEKKVKQLASIHDLKTPEKDIVNQLNQYFTRLSTLQNSFHTLIVNDDGLCYQKCTAVLEKFTEWYGNIEKEKICPSEFRGMIKNNDVSLMQAFGELNKVFADIEDWFHRQSTDLINVNRLITFIVKKEVTINDEKQELKETTKIEATASASQKKQSKTLLDKFGGIFYGKSQSEDATNVSKF